MSQSGMASPGMLVFMLQFLAKMAVVKWPEIARTRKVQPKINKGNAACFFLWSVAICCSVALANVNINHIWLLKDPNLNVPLSHTIMLEESFYATCFCFGEHSKSEATLSPVIYPGRWISSLQSCKGDNQASNLWFHLKTRCQKSSILLWTGKSWPSCLLTLGGITSDHMCRLLTATFTNNTPD